MNQKSLIAVIECKPFLIHTDKTPFLLRLRHVVSVLDHLTRQLTFFSNVNKLQPVSGYIDKKPVGYTDQMIDSTLNKNVCCFQESLQHKCFLYVLHSPNPLHTHKTHALILLQKYHNWKKG